MSRITLSNLDILFLHKFCELLVYNIFCSQLDINFAPIPWTKGWNVKYFNIGSIKPNMVKSKISLSEVFCKKVPRKISQNSHENNCTGVSNKVASLKASKSIKKRLKHGCIPVNCELTAFFTEYWWLLLKIFLDYFPTICEGFQNIQKFNTCYHCLKTNAFSCTKKKWRNITSVLATSFEHIKEGIGTKLEFSIPTTLVLELLGEQLLGAVL